MVRQRYRWEGRTISVCYFRCRDDHDFAGDLWNEFINDILALFDERSLTGRWSLWSELWQYIQEVFWLGSGYGGLWDVPSGGPFERYATWFAAIAPHAHNMYIDMLAQTGFVGMVLFLGLILVHQWWPCGALVAEWNDGRSSFAYRFLYSSLCIMFLNRPFQ